MSFDQEVSMLVQEAQGGRIPIAGVIADAVKEVQRLLEATNDSLLAICTSIEGATTQDELKVAFTRLDKIVRIFVGVAPKKEDDPQLREALSKLELSKRLLRSIQTGSSLRDGVLAYKRTIIKELASSKHQEVTQASLDERMNDQLFAEFFPANGDPAVEALAQKQGKKRLSSVAFPDSSFSAIPKKTLVPALASLHQFSSGEGAEVAVKKNVLVTREKLRAGLNDPKGLLDLTQSSTNALEHTKKLELLKTSGLLFKSRKTKSFSDKLDEASVRLELGLGGNSMADSLVFGAKVLSCPGFLSSRNISDIENNVVDGKSTWKHQNKYGQLMIAGLINQAKRILEKYDDILCGSSPEVLVQESHKTIGNLLRSAECRQLLQVNDKPQDSPGTEFTDIIKKIIEAVAPIVPITLRNKNLDGTYFRSALHLLTAAELLFAQYEADVRIQANPSGVVGMASLMHADIEAACFYNTELRTLRDFTKEIKSQYQTSLGLGTSFPRDALQVSRRRRQRGRGNRFYQGFASQGLSSEQTSQLRSSGESFLSNTRTSRGRGTGECYGYLNGTCRRGATCRFRHEAS